jgi:hypothetical protein
MLPPTQIVGLKQKCRKFRRHVDSSTAISSTDILFKFEKIEATSQQHKWLFRVALAFDLGPLGQKVVVNFLKDKKAVDELAVDKLAVDKLAVDELAVDELAVDELAWHQN